MRRFLVGTLAGRALMSARASCQLARAALATPESVGTFANDHLATVLITRLCRPGKTFVDVGAHIGSVLAEVLRNQPSARCVAVEAVPDKAALLRRTFPGVEVVEAAAGDADGAARFFVDVRRPGYSSLGRLAGVEPAGVREIHVSVKRLDMVVPPDGVDAIKIDVEGAELGVIRGASGILAASRPTIMFESGPSQADGLGYTKEALWRLLADLDYVVLVPNRLAHDGPGLSADGFCESHFYPRRTTNYFGVARERRLEIRDLARRILGIRVPAAAGELAPGI
jgi:FkbM family methyltransferase